MNFANKTPFKLTQRLTVSLLLVFAVVADATAEEVKTEHNGITLNANLEMAQGKTFADGVVVIIHALMQHYDTEIIRGLQKGLKAAGRNSLALTLSMGLDDRHGSYECATPHRYLFADALDEAVAWLQWLKARDVGPVVMLGHSLGANQVLGLTVERYDPQISALVLLSPMTMGRERLVGTYKMRYRLNLEDVSSQARALVDQGRGDELMRVDFHLCPQTQVAATTFLDYYGGEPLHADPSNHLGRVIPPVFIVAGSSDERQPNVAAFLERFVDDEKVFLYTVDSAGHFFRDLNLDEAAEEIIGFLDALDGGAHREGRPHGLSPRHAARGGKRESGFRTGDGGNGGVRPCAAPDPVQRLVAGNRLRSGRHNGGLPV